MSAMKYDLKKIVIGSRESKLAKAHVNIFEKKFQSLFKNEVDLEIRFIKTSGDKFLNKNISDIGNKGLFTKEIDQAQLDGEVDIGIHSLKDLPTTLPKGLEIIAVLKRGYHSDVVYSLKNHSFEKLKKNSIIGTSSLRRKHQILKFRPDLIIKNIRGNVDTRVKKVTDGYFDAIILARAGLNRLGISSNFFSLSTELVVPAPGQGAIAIVVKKDKTFVRKIVQKLNDENTYLEVCCEREFLKALDGSCKTPIGAYAKIKKSKGNKMLFIKYFASSPDGKFLISDKKKFSLSNCLYESYNLGEDVKRQMNIV